MMERFWEIGFDLLIYGGIFVVIISGALLLSSLVDIIVDWVTKHNGGHYKRTIK